MIEGGDGGNAVGGPPCHGLQEHHGIATAGHRHNERPGYGREGDLQRRPQERLCRKEGRFGHPALMVDRRRRVNHPYPPDTDSLKLFVTC